MASPTTSVAVSALRVPLDGDVPAAHAGLLVREDERPFALVGRWAGATAIAGGAPVRVADPEQVDVMALLDEQPRVEGEVAEGFVGGGWFGALGYGLGRRLEPTLGPPPGAPRGERLPAATLGFYDHVLVRDADGRWWFEALWSDARAEALDARRAELSSRLLGRRAARAFSTGPWHATPSVHGHARAVQACRDRIAAGDLFQANLSLRLRAESFTGDLLDLWTLGVRTLAPDRAAWLGAGDAAVSASAGSPRDTSPPVGASPHAASPPTVSPRAASTPDASPRDPSPRDPSPSGGIASLSPELFLTRHGDVVRTAPIKGTRPRPGDVERAEAERAELAASAKDRAENVMIVDLMRNDLGRVCEPGSVEVTTLAEVRPHAGVWHLVSEVSGRLARGVDDAALLAATFPPGSVTGAPKLAAMDVISALEGTARQTFCGAIGFASPTAGLELSVAIRTFEATGTTLWLDVGGGIVADSDPTAEAAECLAKAHPLLSAIGARLAEEPPPDGAAPPANAATPVDATPAGAASPRASTPRDDPTPHDRSAPPDATAATAADAPPHPLRLGAHPVPRPDPAQGVFETILVVDGVGIAVEEHLARLREAASEVYGLDLPEAVEGLVAYTALEQGRSCRIRVVLEPWGDVGVEVAELPAAGAPLRLEPVVVPGGLGDRKWRDRRLIGALDASTAPALPLLVDLDGLVLETTRSNVFAWIGDTLVTPPLDGRLLPGVTRALTLDLARTTGLDVAERPLRLAELRRATAVLTSGALRGLEAATAIGATPLPELPLAMRALAEQFPPLR